MGVVFFTAALGSLATWLAARRARTRSKKHEETGPRPPEKTAPAPRALGRSASRRRKATRPAPDSGSDGDDEYRLTYSDPYGAITDRMIRSLRSEVSNGIVYLDAWCSRRGARRTFRGTQIIDLLHADGEEVRDPISLLALRAERGGPKRLEPLDGHGRAMETLKPSLGALLWITRTDTDVAASELAILTNYAELHQTADGKASEVDVYRLGIWIDHAAPTIATALLGLMQMTPGERSDRLFRDCADRLVRSDGLVDERKARKLSQLLPA